MANPFSSLPVRANGADIFASWFNDIRTALVNYFGSGVVSEAQFTITDNQGSYAAIGFTLDHTVARAYDVELTLYRTNGTSIERRERCVLYCTYKEIAAAWSFSRRTHHGDDALNVANSLNVTAAGVGQFKSDSVGGTYVGKGRYKVVIAFDKET